MQTCVTLVRDASQVSRRTAEDLNVTLSRWPVTRSSPVPAMRSAFYTCALS